MTFNSFVRVLRIIGLLCWIAGQGCAQESLSFKPIWEKASRMLVNEAYQDWEKLFQTGRGSRNQRELDYVQAMLLINRQPKTEDNIDKAAHLLKHITTVNSDDDYGISAAYFLGRLEQVHRSKPNPQKAESIFRELYERHPEHPLAQVAVVKLAILRLLENHLTPEIRRERFMEVEEMGGGLKYPPAVRDYHLLMSNAYIEFCDIPLHNEENALRHLLVVDQIGIARNTIRASMLIRTALLSLKTGNRPQAIHYLERFAKEFKNEPRNYMVQLKLDELKAAEAQQPTKSIVSGAPGVSKKKGGE